MITLYEYPKCTTCRKGKKFLQENDVEFESIDMVKQPPDAGRLSELVERSGRNIDDFFNKRGKKFKELGLKERLDEMTEEEKIELLSTDGMLIRRPLLYDGSGVVIGFKEEEYKQFVNGRN
ncbi:Spx/MgsR family RNA polymerase-binding regulatory protein [Salinicoccus bachuensis]|uniref:Spx/MgsR family RNA polymerase-binding regulatory protein n=1 Tax=Salinicoccus bachuensis TaxID=3136731 RepID=A0ABZ3CJJ7_9STAP